MNDSPLIQRTIGFVKETLKGAEGGHDWFHVKRVYKVAMRLSQTEEADPLIVALAALLHDIADPKFHGGDETLGPEIAKEFLESQKLDDQRIAAVIYIIKNMSFKNSFEKGKTVTASKEFQIVQDADRLDAIGAIGIARTFNYGGYKNRPLYDPNVAPRLHMTKEEYKKSNAPTINHFYEKLLLLKDRMSTKTGKKLAVERHEFMLSYLAQFYKEWNSKL